MHQNIDDSPLYIFDSSFDEDGVGQKMLSSFEVPFYFRDDLFGLVGEARRPPYRWFLVGPERSGSNLHIDPLATSAWNTLLKGVKRWVLFPPSAPKREVKGEHLRQKGEDSEAVTYFARILPRIKEDELAKPGGPTLGMREIMQYPGETIFVPGGWSVKKTGAVCNRWIRFRNGKTFGTMSEEQCSPSVVLLSLVHFL
jgi:histone arginine demethylase JMJD6